MSAQEGCVCRGAAIRHNHSILYNILKSDSLSSGPEDPPQQQLQQQQQQQAQQLLPCSLSSVAQSPRQQPCSCGSTRRRGVLRSPQLTCKAASAVLVKTLRFVKNVPCFRELPEGEQLSLIRSGWAPLLVLGLAQDRVDFDTTETVEPSMLQRILTGVPDRHSELLSGQSRATAGVSVVDIDSIKAFLKTCWSVDISTKEYAYLKGAVLFNPDVEGLRCLHYIQSLRREAHQALNEHVRLVHREDSTRFAKLLIALSMLRAISPPVVAQLFFRPVIGAVNIEEVLMEMFYGK
ncbi:unnamed protein product [Knipowitschia caucasica]